MKAERALQIIDEVANFHRPPGLYTLDYLAKTGDPTDLAIAVMMNQYATEQLVRARAEYVQERPDITSDYFMIAGDILRLYPEMNQLSAQERHDIIALAWYSAGKCAVTSGQIAEILQKNFPALEVTVAYATLNLKYFRAHFVVTVERKGIAGYVDRAWILSLNNLMHYDYATYSWRFPPQHNRFTDVIVASTLPEAATTLRSLEGGTDWLTEKEP